jgi:two-component system, OmpR family, phosphate regulon sensor histidine kinase PhoR
MDAKRINIIISLMAIALIGSIGLQIYWIGWNIRLNEQQFDKNVYAALNRVADKLEIYETTKAAEASSRSGFARTTSQLTGSNGYTALRRSRGDSLPDLKQGRNAFQDDARYWESEQILLSFNSKPLAERIPLDLLAQSVKDELNSHGINTPYQYGVYAKSRNSFVIVNDHYVVIDNSAQVTNGGAASLFNSPYQVRLFRRDLESPGYLALYFPNKTGLVLASVWTTLLMSVLSTCIILFCFSYTIRVILRQKKLSEMKTDFINNMTHEFKTPIATISLATDSITSPSIITNTDKIKRFVDIIRQENKRMNAQVERVLQIAQLDKQDFQLKLGELNLHELIQQAVDNFSLQVDKREGTLRTELLAERPVVEGDMTHIASVIQNLLDNANKYSPEKPDITLRTRNVPNGVEITVQDQGLGISKETRKHIFDKFYRVHTGDVHDVKGFGLGLSYVKAILDAHKGQIDLKSELGKGSSFIVTFPYRVSR